MQSDIREYYECAACKAVYEDALNRAAQKGLTKDTDRIDYISYITGCRCLETLFEIRQCLDDMNIILTSLREEISLKFQSEYRKLSKQEKNSMIKIKKDQ